MFVGLQVLQELRGIALMLLDRPLKRGDGLLLVLAGPFLVALQPAKPGEGLEQRERQGALFVPEPDQLNGPLAALLGQLKFFLGYALGAIGLAPSPDVTR